MYFLTRVSGSALVVGAVLGDTLSQRSPSLPLLWESAAPANLHLHTVVDPLFVPHQIQLSGGFLLFLSLHSLIEQTSIGHPLCARHFREARRIKLALTSKKADIHDVTCPHSELWLWYMLDMRRRKQWQPTPVLCLENPRDCRAWWATLSEVSQNQTWLKWVSSSSSRHEKGSTEIDQDMRLINTGGKTSRKQYN